VNARPDIVISASRKWFSEASFGGLATPWLDPSPIREEIFGPERLAHHAVSLARAQSIADRPKRVLNLTVRLRHNADVLLKAYRYNGAALLAGQQVPLAAQWL
jgi:cyclic beta-1,2-glucan synthetase